MKRTAFTKLALVAALAAVPAVSFAESDVTTGAGTPLTASARLDFRIIVPKFVFLQVGSGTTLADGGSVDMVEFNIPLASLGTGAFAQTTPANVATRLMGNNGAISLTATTTGALSNGTDTISFTTITASAAGATSFAHPTFVDGGTSAAVVVPVTSGTKVTDRTGTWTFSYSNAAIVPAGTYGDIPARNSRVTYTASMP